MSRSPRRHVRESFSLADRMRQCDVCQPAGGYPDCFCDAYANSRGVNDHFPSPYRRERFAIPPPLFVERTGRRFITRDNSGDELFSERSGKSELDYGEVVHELDDDEVVRVHKRAADSALLRLRGAELDRKSVV